MEAMGMEKKKVRWAEGGWRHSRLLKIEIHSGMGGASSLRSLMGDREASRGESVMQRRHGYPVVRRSSRNGTPWVHSVGGSALGFGA